MADESTPQPELTHDAPSQPASPDPKRTKFTEPAPNLTVASILNEAVPTPTPDTAPTHNPMAQHPPPAPQPQPSALPHLPTMNTAPPPPPLQVKLLAPSAKAPSRSSAHAAGYDIYASQPATIAPWSKQLVETDISIAVPADTYGRVAPRSGLASKHGIDVGAGVIDADYRGPVKVLLFNLSGNEFQVNPGDRIAQLIVERIYTPDVVVVDQLEETVRGAGGFGSTGGFGGTLPSINGVTGGAPQPPIQPQ